MIKNIQETCKNFYLSRKQRKTEIERGEGTRGTTGYEEAGCYECDGLNELCSSYYIGKTKNKQED